MKKAETKDRIKEALEIREMKQAELVEKTGIDKGQMSSYLNGRYKPKQNNLYLIAEALSVDEAWLMGYDVPMDSKHIMDVWDANSDKFINEMSQFQAKENAFLHQLKVMGWTCKHIDNMRDAENGDSYYMFKKGGASFQTTWESYNAFIEDSEKFFSNRLETLYGQAKNVLFPLEDKSHLEPVAAHERTDIEVTDEMKQHDMDIMNNDDFWK